MKVGALGRQTLGYEPEYVDEQMAAKTARETAARSARQFEGQLRMSGMNSEDQRFARLQRNSPALASVMERRRIIEQQREDKFDRDQMMADERAEKVAAKAAAEAEKRAGGQRLVDQYVAAGKANISREEFDGPEAEAAANLPGATHDWVDSGNQAPSQQDPSYGADGKAEVGPDGKPVMHATASAARQGVGGAKTTGKATHASVPTINAVGTQMFANAAAAAKEFGLQFPPPPGLADAAQVKTLRDAAAKRVVAEAKTAKAAAEEADLKKGWDNARRVAERLGPEAMEEFKAFEGSPDYHKKPGALIKQMTDAKIKRMLPQGKEFQEWKKDYGAVEQKHDAARKELFKAKQAELAYPSATLSDAAKTEDPAYRAIVSKRQQAEKEFKRIDQKRAYMERFAEQFQVEFSKRGWLANPDGSGAAAAAVTGGFGTDEEAERKASGGAPTPSAPVGAPRPSAPVGAPVSLDKHPGASRNASPEAKQDMASQALAETAAAMGVDLSGAEGAKGAKGAMGASGQRGIAGPDGDGPMGPPPMGPPPGETRSWQGRDRDELDRTDGRSWNTRTDQPERTARYQAAVADEAGAAEYDVASRPGIRTRGTTDEASVRHEARKSFVDRELGRHKIGEHQDAEGQRRGISKVKIKVAGEMVRDAEAAMNRAYQAGDRRRYQELAAKADQMRLRYQNLVGEDS